LGITSFILTIVQLIVILSEAERTFCFDSVVAGLTQLFAWPKSWIKKPGELQGAEPIKSKTQPNLLRWGIYNYQEEAAGDSGFIPLPRAMREPISVPS
jgi:hypothetical protein